MASKTYVFELRKTFNVKMMICCRLKLLEKALNPYLSAYQAQKEICREILTQYPNSLACPCLGDDELYLLLKREDLEKQPWMMNFVKMGIEFIGEDEISDQLLASLVWYSVMVRLSPEWNRVGSYFVKGRNFLRGINATLSAVAFKVHCRKSDSLKFVVVANEIKLHPINYGLVITDLWLQEKRRILIGTWCHVLPKMSKGVIVSIQRRMPKKCALVDYEGLKKYWRNVYGYLLPKDSKEMLFYEIYFAAIRPEPFTYPSCCVLMTDLEVIDECRQSVERNRETVTSFSLDLQLKLGEICES